MGADLGDDGCAPRTPEAGGAGGSALDQERHAGHRTAGGGSEEWEYDGALPMMTVGRYQSRRRGRLEASPASEPGRAPAGSVPRASSLVGSKGRKDGTDGGDVAVRELVRGVQGGGRTLSRCVLAVCASGRVPEARDPASVHGAGRAPDG